MCVIQKKIVTLQPVKPNGQGIYVHYFALRIDLKALHEGENTAVYELDDAYFKAIAAPDIQKGTLALRFKAKRIGDLYELDFHVEGIVYVACDMCLEEMELPIQNDGKLTARLGEENVEEATWSSWTRKMACSMLLGMSMSLSPWPFPSSMFMSLDSVIQPWWRNSSSSPLTGRDLERLRA